MTANPCRKDIMSDDIFKPFGSYSRQPDDNDYAPSSGDNQHLP